MEFTWSEAKRATNIKAHGLDFVDAQSVFEGLTYTFEDDRFSYGEQRFVTLGLLAGIAVSVVHTKLIGLALRPTKRRRTPNTQKRPSSTSFAALFVAGLRPCRLRHRFHCVWIRMCWSGSKRRALVTKPE